MASLTYYARRLFLDWRTGKGDMPASTGRYIGLFTAPPNAAGGGVEVSGSAYARKSMVASLPYADSLATPVVSEAAITFTPASGTWGTITHVGVFDAPTEGNLIEWAPLPAGISIGNGDAFVLPVGALTFEMA